MAQGGVLGCAPGLLGGGRGVVVGRSSSVVIGCGSGVVVGCGSGVCDARAADPQQRSCLPDLL
eukprot:2471619-Amphidinium_carterae.1